MYCYIIPEIAERLKVSKTTVLKWVKDGQLKAIESYGCRPKYKITEDDLEDFINSDFYNVKHATWKEKHYYCERTIEIKRADGEHGDESDLNAFIRGLRLFVETVQNNPVLMELIMEEIEETKKKSKEESP